MARRRTKPLLIVHPPTGEHIYVTKGHGLVWVDVPTGETFAICQVEDETVREITERVLRWLDDMGSLRCGGATTKGMR